MRKLFSLFLVAMFSLALIPDTSEGRCGKGRSVRSRVATGVMAIKKCRSCR